MFFLVVIVFTKQSDAERLIRAANENPQSRGYFKWIGTDAWTEQLPDQFDDYLESLNGNDLQYLLASTILYWANRLLLFSIAKL